MASKDFNRLMLENEKKRNLMTKKMKKEIRSLYQDLHKDYLKKLLKVQSGSMSEKILYSLKKELEGDIRRLNNEIYKTTKKSIEAITSEAINSQRDIWLSIDKQFNLGLNNQFKQMFFMINEKVVAEILNGDLYKDGMGLSERLWFDGKLMGKDVQNIIAKGIAGKQSNFEVAARLEQYLDPKHYSSTIYEASKKKIEFNSYRLAHTAIAHAYQQTVRRSAKSNPYVEAIRWRSVLQKRTCDLCRERDGQLYTSDNLPQDTL